MKTPTIASPARMSESTYNKFTARFPYVCRKSTLPCADGPMPMQPRPGARADTGPNTAGIPIPAKSAHDSNAGGLRIHSWGVTMGSKTGMTMTSPSRPHPERSRQTQRALLIRAFLRCHEGGRNCRHNSLGISVVSVQIRERGCAPIRVRELVTRSASAAMGRHDSRHQPVRSMRQSALWKSLKRL